MTKITCKDFVEMHTLDNTWIDEHVQGYERATSANELIDSPLYSISDDGNWIDEDGNEFLIIDPENMNQRYLASHELLRTARQNTFQGGE